MHFHKLLTESPSLAAAALLGCCVLSPAWSDSGLASQSTNLEVIVKFSHDSDAGRRVERILSKDPMDLDDFAEAQKDLGRSTGYVLIAQRISSGREVIFGIPEKPLLERIEQTVAKRPEIANTELVAVQNDNPRLAEELLLLRFHASSDESALLGNAYDDDAYAERVQALATELCAASGVPVIGTPHSPTALAITLDRHALLEQLVARLHELDYVDYAQPNSIVQFMK